MRREKNKQQIKVGWIILGVILFCIALFGTYLVRPLNYEQAIEKANQFQKENLYYSNYIVQKDGLCTIYFTSRTNIAEKQFDVLDEEIAKRIENEYKK